MCVSEINLLKKVQFAARFDLVIDFTKIKIIDATARIYHVL